MLKWQWLKDQMNVADSFKDVKEIADYITINHKDNQWQWLNEQYEEAKYVIHRTSRKEKEELYVNTTSGYYSSDKSLAIKFTLKEAIQLRNELNDERENKQNIWVISEV